MTDEPNNTRTKYLESVNYVGTTIRDDDRDNLQISWDEEDGFILFFTPDMGNTDNHYHIELDRDQVFQLSEFLRKKLEEIR
ncbi:MAG: hypothetical protein WBD27_17370 [Pyrinomonadaceae bacterium]